MFNGLQLGFDFLGIPLPMHGSPAHEVLRHVTGHTMCTYTVFDTRPEHTLDVTPERQIDPIEGGEVEQNRGRAWLVLTNGMYVEVQPQVEAPNLGTEFAGATLQQIGITIREALESAPGAIAIVVATYQVRTGLYTFESLQCLARPAAGWQLQGDSQPS